MRNSYLRRLAVALLVAVRNVSQAISRRISIRTSFMISKLLCRDIDVDMAGSLYTIDDIVYPSTFDLFSTPFGNGRVVDPDFLAEFITTSRYKKCVESGEIDSVLDANLSKIARRYGSVDSDLRGPRRPLHLPARDALFHDSIMAALEGGSTEVTR